MPRRRALLAAALLPSLARAEEAFPNRPLRFVVPFTPGGSTDILARVIAGRLAGSLGQPVVVENRPGAGGTVGTELVARAAPDGHTLLMGHIGTLAVNPGLYPRLGYDPVSGLAPVCRVAMVPNLLVVNPQRLPVTGVAGLLAAARAQPGGLAFGSGGNGSAAHMAMTALAFATGTEFTHVPYRGTAPMVNDLIAGQLALTMTGTPAVLPQVRQGLLRAIAVSSLRRIAAAPELPPVAETVPGFEADQWYGVVAPGGTPAPVIARLNAAITEALAAEDVLQRRADEGVSPAPGTPAEFGAFIAAGMDRWGGLIRRAGMRAD